MMSGILIELATRTVTAIEMLIRVEREMEIESAIGREPVNLITGTIGLEIVNEIETEKGIGTRKGNV